MQGEEQVSLTYITSKGGKVLLAEGHRYHRHVLNLNGTSLWRCDQYKSNKLKCTGSVSVSLDGKIFKRKPHCDTCCPDFAHNLIEETISKHCDEAIQGKEPAPRVYKKGLAFIQSQGWHLATKKPVPTFEEKKSGIYRQKKIMAGVQTTKTTIPEMVEVPVQYKDFLLADYFHDGIRIIVFSSLDARAHLARFTDYFMDGTFQACPAPFRQIYVIHADMNSGTTSTDTVPLVFALMTHQTKDAYMILFNLIRAQVPEWQPKRVIIDFERAVMHALSKMNVEIHGCYYHFCNSLCRKAKALGIKKSPNNRRVISLCCKLALLPEAEITEGWKYIKNEVLPEDGLGKFIKYFENNWMKGDYYKIWCVYGLRHRTNNIVEGWNHNINTNINKNEVQLMQILHILHQEAALASLKCDRSERFEKKTAPKRRKMTIANDQRILFAQTQLTNGEISVGHFLEKLRLSKF